MTGFIHFIIALLSAISIATAIIGLSIVIEEIITKINN